MPGLEAAKEETSGAHHVSPACQAACWHFPSPLSFMPLSGPVTLPISQLWKLSPRPNSSLTELRGYPRALLLLPALKVGETSGGPLRAWPCQTPALPLLGSWRGTPQRAWLRGSSQAGQQNCQTACSSHLPSAGQLETLWSFQQNCLAGASLAFPQARSRPREETPSAKC